MTELELAEANEEHAKLCEEWAREARQKSKALLEIDPEGAKTKRRLARGLAEQARQLREDAARLRAQAGDKPQVGSHRAWKGAVGMKKW